MSHLSKNSQRALLAIIVLVAMVLGASLSVHAQDNTVAITEFKADDILATGRTFTGSFVQNGFEFSLKADDPTTILMNGNGYQDAPRPQNSHVMAVGGNNQSGTYFLNQSSMFTFSTANKGFVPTNANVNGGNILRDGLVVYSADANGCLIVFDKAQPQPQMMKVVSGGDYGFTLQAAKDCGDVPHFAMVAHLQWMAAVGNVTVDEMTMQVFPPALPTIEATPEVTPAPGG